MQAEPIVTQAAAGSYLTINGSNFGLVTGSVYFEPPAQPAVTAIVDTWTDTSIVVCVPSSLTPGVVNVSIVNSSTGLTSNQKSFTVNQAPGVTGVTPSFGSAAGGTLVKIIGVNFNTVLGVNFGTNAALKTVQISETEIDAISPPGIPGSTVHITVETLQGSTAEVEADKFTYEIAVAPQISWIFHKYR